MEFTGERYMPDLEMPDLAYEHWHRYLFAVPFVENKIVLDIASGEGYGSNLLAQTAERVVGIDSDEKAIAHARDKYQKENLQFILGAAQGIPIEGEHLFDVVVSFETIEHLDRTDQQAFLSETKRLLKPDGLLLISTPNKLVYSDIPNYQNEFHKSEFYLDEYRAFLESSFADVRILSQRIYAVSYMWDEENAENGIDEYRLSYSERGFGPTQDQKETRYAVAVCSSKRLDPINNSILVDVSEKMINSGDGRFMHLYSHLQRLAAKSDGLVQQLKISEKRVESLKTQMATQEETNKDLVLQLDKARAQIRSLHEIRARAANQLREMTQSYAWSFVTRLRKLRLLFIPRGSRRERLFQRFLRWTREPKRKIDNEVLLDDDLLEHAKYSTCKDLPPITSKISVVIPTKNAGDDFKRLLNKLKSQHGIGDLELIIVDSGSTDKTIEIAKNAGATVVEIAPEEFSHSASRNKGADLASGDYILFTVQDAMPISDIWLWSLAKALGQSKQLALISCAEYPRSDADLFYRLISSNHYRALGLDRDRILRLNASRMDHFSLRSCAQINNVASLFRRDAFTRYRFNEAISYAEDLEMGLRLIKDGQQLGFLYSNRVIHSHNRPPLYFFKRAYVDTRFLSEIFADYPHANVPDLKELAQDVMIIHNKISKIESDLREMPLPIKLSTLFETTRSFLADELIFQSECANGHHEHGDFIGSMREMLGLGDDIEKVLKASDSSILPHYLQHLAIAEAYMSSIYDQVDDKLLDDFIDALYKILALQSGAQVGSYFLTCQKRHSDDPALDHLDRKMTASI